VLWQERCILTRQDNECAPSRLKLEKKGSCASKEHPRTKKRQASLHNTRGQLFLRKTSLHSLHVRCQSYICSNACDAGARLRDTANKAASRRCPIPHQPRLVYNKDRHSSGPHHPSIVNPPKASANFAVSMQREKAASRASYPTHRKKKGSSF